MEAKPVKRPTGTKHLLDVLKELAPYWKTKPFKEHSKLNDEMGALRKVIADKAVLKNGQYQAMLRKKEKSEKYMEELRTRVHNLTMQVKVHGATDANRKAVDDLLKELA